MRTMVISALLGLAVCLAACGESTQPTGHGGHGGHASDGGNLGGSGGIDTPIDDDGDGFALPDDCDDSNPAINPGAEEICNGVDDDCDDIIDDGIPTDGDGCKEPPPPEFDDIVDTVVVSIRTGIGVNDGSDSNDLSLCLSATDCYVLDVVDVDDRRIGELDVYHYEGLSLPRSQIDRVQILSQNGSDRWVPACMEIQLDGEPVYCKPSMTHLWFGNESPELEEWTDPLGLHVSCTTCFDSPLSHGPMVGEVGPNHAQLWVRTHATVLSKLRVSESDVADASPVAFAYPAVSADYAHSFRVEGLEPETTYQYDVEVEGERTETLTFRTAPELDQPTQLRFAFGSCTRHDAQPIFAQVDALAPDLFVFVGDNHYADSPDLSSLRWHYRWGLERSQRRTLLEHTPTIAIWDDHDYVGNNTQGSSAGKDVALRVFGEYWANPSVGTDQIPGVFFRYRWGDIDFFMLDDRYYRAFNDSVLGSAQTGWLEQELAASTATFKLIASGSQFTSFGTSDSWAAFPAATDQLFDFIRDQNIDGVVLLSGDVHRSSFRLIERGNDGAYDLPELTSSPMANTNASCKTDGELVSCFDDNDYFIVVDIDTGAVDPTVDARIVDVTGAVMDSWLITKSELSL